MENVVFDGRNIFQRRYQNRTFPNRVHKKIIFRKMSKNEQTKTGLDNCSELSFSGAILSSLTL